jgi:anti-sigma factor RsiW
MTWTGNWEDLRRIGDYVAGELSPKEAWETERLMAENAEGRRLADSYTQMLALLRAISKQTPDPPGAIKKRAVAHAMAHAVAHAMKDKNEEERI